VASSWFARCRAGPVIFRRWNLRRAPGQCAASPLPVTPRAGSPSDVWREGCWRFVVYPGIRTRSAGQHRLRRLPAVSPARRPRGCSRRRHRRGARPHRDPRVCCSLGDSRRGARQPDSRIERPGRRPSDAMESGFECVRTHWIRGFMALSPTRQTQVVMLMVPVRVARRAGSAGTYRNAER
jgi:hypothetical protein